MPLRRKAAGSTNTPSSPAPPGRRQANCSLMCITFQDFQGEFLVFKDEYAPDRLYFFRALHWVTPSWYRANASTSARDNILVLSDAARQALESDYTAMADSGMLRGELPSFPGLLARISQMEEHCNAIARSLALAAEPFRSGPIRGDRFCAFRPCRACQRPTGLQKRPLAAQGV